MDNSKKIEFSRHKRADAHVTSETEMACTGRAQVKPDQIPTQRRESGHNFHLESRIYLQVISGRGKSVFLSNNEEESVNVHLTA